MKKIVFIIALSLFGSCSRSPTLNLRSRTFGMTPKNVIWIQLPGFEMEHASMVRFGSSDSRRPIALEDVDCVGAAWSYNYYDLRTTADESALAQLTGGPDIKNSCAGEDRYPAWQYYRSLGFSTLAVEFGADKKSSLTAHQQCNNDTFLEGLTWLSMRQADDKIKKSAMFHYQSQKVLQEGKLNWDQTCQGDKGRCFAPLSSNIKTIWESHVNKSRGIFFLVRDFEYLNQLKRGKIQAAREALSEIDKVVAYFKSLPNADQNLLLITGGETQSLLLPKRGKEWDEFEKRGKNVIAQRSKLMSPVLAKGASAENFCGVYEESRILYRQFWRNQSTNFSLENIIGSGN